MAEIKITVDGLDELQADLEKLIKRYPDKAGDILKKNAKDFRKEYITNVQGAVKHSSGKSKSLTKTKNVKIYPIRGYGKDQSVDVGATSPHFHLFERGHNKIIPWMPSVTGTVEGRHVMEKSINDYEDKMPEVVQKMYDELLKEGNLL